MEMRLVSLLIGYCFGCLLTADVVSRRLVHKSAFDLGVGNPGMANIGHELGVRAALLVLTGDILKTVCAWLIARSFVPLDPTYTGLWAGLGVTLGHNYPVWHRFRGGKGVTTTCSATILTHPLLGLISSIFGAVIVGLSGYLCVGAIAITALYLLLVALFISTGEQIAVAAILLVLMLLAHGSQVIGIRTGETTRTSLLDKVLSKLRLHTHTSPPNTKK